MSRGVPVEPGMSAAEMLAELVNTAAALHITHWISESEALVRHLKVPALMLKFFELLRCITIALERDRVYTCLMNSGSLTTTYNVRFPKSCFQSWSCSHHREMV